MKARSAKAVLRLAVALLAFVAMTSARVSARFPCHNNDILINEYWGFNECLNGNTDDGYSADWYCVWVDWGTYVNNVDPGVPTCVCCLDPNPGP